MIGIDTNVLVRYITLDDPIQTPAAVKLVDSLTQDEPGFVSLVVTAELTWVLEVCYKFEKKAVVRVLEALLRSKEVMLEQASVISESLHLFTAGTADFADYLIERGARAAGCSYTYTLDQKAAASGMRLLK
jgi:predicted nucleic-acid-binding protein